MAVDVLIGLQWGDEGKGKIVDYLSQDYDMVCRFQGGPNAGHTIYLDKTKMVLHTIPSGVFRQGVINVIGNGVVIDPITLRREIETLERHGIKVINSVKIARKAHLILPTHRLLDAASEASKGSHKIGSTLRGIGPTYMDKTGRNGLRMGDTESSYFKEKYHSLKSKHLGLLKIYPEIDFDLENEEKKWLESIEFLRQMDLVDGEYFINDALDKGMNVLAEGAQGSMLDIDFGTYPYVTSSNTVTAGVCNGLGVAPRTIRKVIGISKAYCTRVGSGPFPTELFDGDGEELARIGHEFGATTGRPRRCGWIDLPQLKYTVMINGVTDLAITKIDVLNTFKSVKAATAYNVEGNTTKQLPFDIDAHQIDPLYELFDGWLTDLGGGGNDNLPDEAMKFINYIEEYLGVPVSYISKGPGREELVVRDMALNG